MSSFKFSFGSLIVIFEFVFISHLPDLKKYRFFISVSLKLEFSIDRKRLKKIFYYILQK